MILKFFEKNRIDFLKDQFKDINPDKFNRLYNIDPTENKKYLQWILNQYKKGFVIDNNLKNHLIKLKYIITTIFEICNSTKFILIYYQ